MHYRVLVITKNNSFYDVVKSIRRFKKISEADRKNPHILCFDYYQIGGRFFHGKYTVKVTEIDELGVPFAVVTPIGIIGVEHYDGNNYIPNSNFNVEFDFIKNKYSNYFATVVDVHM